MALNSINTNISAMRAQGNIGRASTASGSSIARLSSGNRIVQASDDVAAMSAGTSLRTNVTTLKMALLNTSQGTSLLQVADGALSQITDILQRQKAIAVQAGSGSLTSSERSFLNQEFQNLTQEVQRLAEKTNFNGVNLLDGVLTKTVKAQDVSTNAARASASMSYSTNAVATDTVILNGVTMVAQVAAPTLPTQFRLGGTVNETLNNLANQLNASTDVRLSGATYSVTGSTLTITAKAGGLAGQDFIIDGRQAATSWVADTANLNSGSISGPNLGSFSNLVTSPTLGLGVANITDSAVGAVPSASIPFTVGQTLLIQQGTAPAATVLTALVAGESLSGIVDRVNINTSVHGYTASIVGSSGNYNLQFRHANPDLDIDPALGGGDMTFTGLMATAALGNTGLAITPTVPAGTVNVVTTGLGGGGTTGIGAGHTVGTGIIGDALVTDQSQTRSISTIVFPPITPANLATTLAPTVATPVTINIGEVATVGERASFSFTRNTAANAGPMEIVIGATLEETIDNAVSRINNFTGNGIQNFDLNQIKAYRDGQSLVIESLDFGSTTHLDINALPTTSVGVSVTNSVTIIASSATLNNGVTSGISSSNVMNKDFVGKLSGMKASYVSTNVVNLSMKVGDFTYTANTVATTPTANTTVRFSADGGGYFDVQMRANSGSAVTNQATSDAFAGRFDAAFSTLTFYQNRDVSSYKGTSPIVTDGVVTGSLIGSSVKMQDKDFSSLKIENISVNAPLGSSPNGVIEFTINGEKYASLRGMGGRLGANQTYQFVSQSDANRFIEFTTGNATVDFSTTARAASTQKALEAAFGVGAGNESLSFQVGANSDDSLKIGLAGVTSKDLGIENIDVLTQASASLASDAIGEALNRSTSVRAEVGALQSRFNFAAANVETSIANQDAARGVLLDTDIATESTAFATAQVQLQAGISVLAQANLLPQNLLKLIG